MVVHFPSEDPDRAAHHDASALFEAHGATPMVREALEQTHGTERAVDALHRFDEKHVGYKREDLVHNNRSLSVKETVERFAFGIGNLQLLNVLLITVVPNYLLAGIILALRSVFSGVVESGYQSFSGSFRTEQRRSFWFGNLLGYSFVLSALFITFSAVESGVASVVFRCLFALSFLSIGVFGALYLQSGLRLKGGSMNKDRMRHYLKWISYYGIVLVAAVFLGAGIVLDVFSNPIAIHIGHRPLLIYGYALLLFGTGILVLVAAYLSTRLRRIRPLDEAIGSLSAHFSTMRASLRSVVSEGGFERSMLVSGMLFYSAQLALNYFLGVHLYEHFKAFTPVAVLFSATLLTMFAVPLFFDRRTLRLNGRSSLFLYGSGLALFVPITFMLVLIPGIREPLIAQLSTITTIPQTAVDFLPMIYLLIGIAGSSIAGIAFSRLALDTMKPDARIEFMRSLGALTPLSSGALILLAFGLRALTGSAIASFAVLAFSFLVTIVIFASLVAGRLEQRFEQQALAPHKV